MNTQYVFNAAGERTSVIIPITEYEELLNAAAIKSASFVSDALWVGTSYKLKPNIFLIPIFNHQYLLN
jgi:hypothetical protein